MKSFIKCKLVREEKGQALNEFILFALLFALFFGGMVHLQKKSAGAISTLMEARNNVFSADIDGSTSPYLAYVNTTSDLGRFREAYVAPLNGEKVPLIELSNSPFVASQFRGYEYSSDALRTEEMIRGNMYGKP